MSQYSVRDVLDILGIPRSLLSALIDAGFVNPARGTRREYRFSFQDLILLRTAQGLASARISPAKVARALKRLRDALPQELPLSGLRITAVGNQVAVRASTGQWQADSGQYLLDFEMMPVRGSVKIFDSFDRSRLTAPKRSEPTAEEWFDRGVSLEDENRTAARQAYEKAIALEPAFAEASINLGRLLHDSGELDSAEQVYRRAIAHCPGEALLFFNLGVLLEDLGRQEEAAHAYRSALVIDEELADAHYNLARLCEARGKSREALRHYSTYRRLTISEN
jgi:tetratricopeptide (TPR) repeat protein